MYAKSVAAKVLLQGAYDENTGLMSSDFDIPLNQPFVSVYGGSESLVSILVNMAE